MDESIREHYRALYADHGDAPAAVQYSSRASQHRRFEVLCEIVPELTSVLDVGCGLGHLLEHLLERGFVGHYAGVDFVEEFVAANRRRFGPPHRFAVADVFSDPLPEGYDLVLLSGVFNNRVADNEARIQRMVQRMFDVCRVGVAFNALSTYVDYRDEGLHYTDPLALFDHVKRTVTPKVVLRHDYLVKPDSIPFEFTMYLYR